MHSNWDLYIRSISNSIVLARKGAYIYLSVLCPRIGEKTRSIGQMPARMSPLLVSLSLKRYDVCFCTAMHGDIYMRERERERETKG